VKHQPTQHPVVEEYLAELARLLRGLDPAEAAETLSGVREHIDASLAGDAGDEAVRRVLTGLGPPEAVADAAYGGAAPRSPVPDIRPGAANRPWVPVVVALLQALGLLVIVLVASTWSSVSESSVTATTSQGEVTSSSSSQWNGTAGLFAPALLGVVWLWIPVALLVGLSDLWSARAKVLQFALLPLGALSFALLPELGHLVAGINGGYAGAWTALALVLLGGAYATLRLARAGREAA
jgi:hypothetical protein